MKFSVDSSFHFYTWKRSVLEAAKENGIPLKSQWSCLKSFLEGNVLARVNAEMPVTSRPSLEQILMVLQKFFGSPNIIMEQIIKAHENYGPIPSHLDTACRAVYQSASGHLKLLASARDLADAVGDSDTTCSWSYQSALEAVLPQG
jgi:hypothetical protein